MHCNFIFDVLFFAILSMCLLCFKTYNTLWISLNGVQAVTDVVFQNMSSKK